jgi:tRNA pseudouridine65 synthase
MKVLEISSNFCVLDKPPGFFVHPPEASRYPVAKEKICLYALESELGKKVYPVHRLDAATSGLVLFAFSKTATRLLSRLFKDREIQKTYHAVVRGFTADEGVIDFPLEIKGFRDPISARTSYRTLSRLELPYPVGPEGRPARYPTSRYSYLEVSPETGRWHQIRRHFDRIAHPLIGDVDHGDSHHNRHFRDRLGIPGLCLRATRLSFQDPWTGLPVTFEAPSTEQWQKLHKLFSLT